MSSDRWYLHCEGFFIYSTGDQEDADSWVAADPAQHTAETERRPTPGEPPPAG